MNVSLSVSLIAVPLGLMAASLAQSDLPSPKCARVWGVSGPNYLYLVDVAVVDSMPPPESLFDSLRTESVEIVCRPEALRRFGASGAAGVVSIFTRDAQVARMEATLASLVASQRSYVEQHGRYAESLNQLDRDSPEEAMTIAIDLAAGEWSATASHVDVASRCRVSSEAENVTCHDAGSD